MRINVSINSELPTSTHRATTGHLTAAFSLGREFDVRRCPGGRKFEPKGGGGPAAGI